jgi:hypothetical protein
MKCDRSSLRGAKGIGLPNVEIRADMFCIALKVYLNQTLLWKAHRDQCSVYNANSAAERFTPSQLIPVVARSEADCLTWNFRSPDCVQQTRLSGAPSLGQDRHCVPVSFCELC